MDTFEFLFTSKSNGLIMFFNEKLNFIEHLVHLKGALTNYIAIFTTVKVQTRVRKVEKIYEDSLYSIPSPLPSVKIPIMSGKVYLR